jgi:hypothetical protein
MNNVILTGKVKNITEREFGNLKFLTATLNSYDTKTGRIAVTMQLVGYEGQGAALLRSLIQSQESEPTVTVEGELDTLFDRSNKPQDQRRAPWTRIAVTKITQA